MTTPILPSGTRDLSDTAFVAAFEGCTLPNDRFRHWDHLRLAWLLIRAAGGPGNVAGATVRMTAALQRFAFHHGGSLEKYHDTLTRAYMHFVAAHIAETPALTDFAEFAAAHPKLFEKHLPTAFYSQDRLMSSEARTGWLDPDIRPLPAILR